MLKLIAIAGISFLGIFYQILVQKLLFCVEVKIIHHPTLQRGKGVKLKSQWHKLKRKLDVKWIENYYLEISSFTSLTLLTIKLKKFMLQSKNKFKRYQSPCLTNTSFFDNPVFLKNNFKLCTWIFSKEIINALYISCFKIFLWFLSDELTEVIRSHNCLNVNVSLILAIKFGKWFFGYMFSTMCRILIVNEKCFSEEIGLKL